MGLPALGFLLHHQIFASQLTSRDPSFTEHLLLCWGEKVVISWRQSQNSNPALEAPKPVILTPTFHCFLCSSQQAGSPFPSEFWVSHLSDDRFFSPKLYGWFWQNNTFSSLISSEIITVTTLHRASDKKKKGKCKHYVFPRLNLHKLHIRWSRPKTALCLEETKMM